MCSSDLMNRKGRYLVSIFALAVAIVIGGCSSHHNSSSSSEELVSQTSIDPKLEAEARAFYEEDQSALTSDVQGRRWPKPNAEVVVSGSARVVDIQYRQDLPNYPDYIYLWRVDINKGRFYSLGRFDNTQQTPSIVDDRVPETGTFRYLYMVSKGYYRKWVSSETVNVTEGLATALKDRAASPIAASSDPNSDYAHFITHLGVLAQGMPSNPSSTLLQNYLDILMTQQIVPSTSGILDNYAQQLPYISYEIGRAHV